MRLLECDSDGEFSLTKDLVNNIPAYVILSHTWGDDDQEVTFKEMAEGSGKSKAGYQKIRFCGEQAGRDGLRHFWVDTCCIDKSNSAELSEALNSMYRWYRNATKCYVYLADVPTNDWASTFENSRWFTRGWTLQELIAPQTVEFFSFEGHLLGDRRSLEQLIHRITDIAVPALRGKAPSEFSVKERFSWAAKRETKKEEDKAYSLLGIFGINMYLLYGEGRENAFRRLRKKVGKSDTSNEFGRPLNSGVEIQPKFTVPFVRDPKFVGREDIIQDITNQLETQRRLALCGIGGIGKSQIAIEYCYKWKNRYPDSHVFWVHANTFDRFEQTYRDIAKEISLPGSEVAENNTLVIVRDWLSNPENGSWLLVLDNADDLALFFGSESSAKEPSSPRVSNLLPQNVNGSMIITTRDIRVGYRLIDREEVIMVTPLSPLDASQLLRSKIPKWNNVNTEEIQGLAEILGFIPLAITQAAAFIQENGIVIKTYFEKLQESDSDLQDYLEEDLPDPRRYPDNENSVIRTWKLSFDQIAKQRPRAAEMLSLMVLLDRQAIPKTLLKQGNERNIDFDKAVGTLQAYSLIKTEKGGSSFEVHRLIQLSTRRWLSLQKKQAEWEEKALELMVERFPSGEYGTWQECEDLFLHAKSVVKYEHIPEAARLRRAELIEKVARYDESQGRFEVASLQYKDVLQIRESNLSETHPSTLIAMSNLALVLDRQGKYAEAETMNRQTLELKEEVLGKKHPSTLTTMSNLALVLNKQGKYAEAETMNRQTLELKEEVLGKKHPSTLTTMSNLAGVLDSQGKYAEAETMSRQTLELMEEVLGKKHPETLTSVYCLAYLLQNKKEYEEASILYQRACTGYELLLGSQHPRTIACISNYSKMLDDIRKGNLG